MLSSRGLSLLSLPDLSFNLSAAQSNPFHPQNNPTGIINLGTAENRVCEKEVSDKLEEFRLSSDVNRCLQRYSGIGGVRGPFYARVRTDCGERSECIVKGVPLDMDNPRLIVNHFQKEFDRWNEKEGRVRAIIIMNPHNPLGNIYKKDELVELCEWSMDKNLFIIVDEILSETIYSHEDRQQFHSILDLLPLFSKPQQIVWMSSLSKDMGIPGVRTSLIVTPSSLLLRCLIRLESLNAVPAPDQLIVHHLLKDRDWVSSIFSSVRIRLSVHSQFLFSSLLSINVHCILPKAGMTLMADFSKYLPSVTLEEEDSLHLRLVHAGVILTKGGPTQAPSPGWFRIAFGVPKEELELGVARIYETLVPGRKVEGQIRYVL